MKQENGSILCVKCISNIGYEASLTIGKTYKARRGQFGALCVWDNENELYGYPDDLFEIVT